MPDITFDMHVAGTGKALEDWEREASTAFLRVVYDYRMGPTGKTFLLQKMASMGDVVCFEDKGLRPWQWEAAVAFYSACLRSKAAADDQQQLVKKLSRFIEEHGNTFRL